MEEPKALECSKDMCLSDLDNNYLKIDIKRERNQKSLVKDQTFEVMLAQHNGSDKSSCDACREKKLQVNTALGEKSVIALSSLFTKDLLDKQKSWSLGGKIQTEPENKVTLCKVHAKSPKCDGVGLPTEEKQLSETSVSLSDEKQWHDINVYLGLSSCSKQPDRLDGDGHDRTGTSEVSCCTPNVVCIGDNDLSESKCCHPSNIIIEAPGHMTDTEWMNIFKPSRAQRIVRHKTMCTCSRSVSAMKYNSSASELIGMQPSQCVGSLKSAEREEESAALPDRRTSANEKDDFSPTSKLQRLLAESRQMVTDLELSTLLPISCENLNRSKLEVSEEPDEKTTLVSH